MPVGSTRRRNRGADPRRRPRAADVPCFRGSNDTPEDTAMSKGLDKKKEQKKKPAKTMKEKRAEKNEKKQTRGFAPT
jgi:hypothetical protein